MSFPYKHILLIGASSGIGAALADLFIAKGIKVTAVGRRQDRLDAFVSKHASSSLASSLTFNITELDGIPAFVEKATTTHPTIDAIFLNAGQQRRFNFAQPSTVDLKDFNNEVLTNFTSFVALTHAFLPYLQQKSTPVALLYTGSHISLIPAPPMPAYSASKAALESFLTCLRLQLLAAAFQTQTRPVNVIHISPPGVQTELHDREMGVERGRAFGMPIDQFVDQAWAKLDKGEQDVFVGSAAGSTEEQFLEIVGKRGEALGRMVEVVRKIAQAEAAGN